MLHDPNALVIILKLFGPMNQFRLSAIQVFNSAIKRGVLSGNMVQYLWNFQLEHSVSDANLFEYYTMFNQSNIHVGSSLSFLSAKRYV